MLPDCVCGDYPYQDSSKSKHGKYAVPCASRSCPMSTVYFSSPERARKAWTKLLAGDSVKVKGREPLCN